MHSKAFTWWILIAPPFASGMPVARNLHRFPKLAPEHRGTERQASPDGQGVVLRSKGTYCQRLVLGAARILNVSREPFKGSPHTHHLCQGCVLENGSHVEQGWKEVPGTFQGQEGVRSPPLPWVSSRVIPRSRSLQKMFLLWQQVRV